MSFYWRILLLSGLLVVSSRCAWGQADRAEDQHATRAGNLVQNGGFEMDWMHNSVTANSRFQLLEQSDWGYAQSDGQPDSWVLPEDARRDPTQARTGNASLKLRGTATQVVYLCGETEPQSGGAFYNPLLPLNEDLRKHVVSQRLVIGAWCKTQNASQEPQLLVTLEFPQSTKSFQADFGKASHDWQYREIEILLDKELGQAQAAVIRLNGHGSGDIWFDGVSVVEDATPEPNLLPNGSFEQRDDNGHPMGWSEPRLWTWSRRNYYRFTGWSHREGNLTGGATLTDCGRSGRRSLCLTVPPGDNFAVVSAPIPLHQAEPRPIAVSAWIAAEDLRWMEIMAQDDTGAWLPQLDFSGFMGTDQHYRNRVLGIGTHDWEFVRKYFAPKVPLKQITLWLCARGLDGKLLDRHKVGRIWFDDVELRECGTSPSILADRGVVVPQVSNPPDKLPAASAPLSPLIDTEVSLRTGALYVYPDEKLEIGINVCQRPNTSCEIAIVQPGKRDVILAESNLTSKYWQFSDPRPPLLVGGFVRADNLISLSVDASRLPLHPASCPVRDCQVELKIVSDGGKILETHRSVMFGAMERPATPTLPEAITTTKVRDDGVILVNGKPWIWSCFPTEKTDLGAITRMQNFPKDYKVLPLPFPESLIIPASEDSQWKARVESLVKQHKDEPRLFGYFFAHNGETSFWFDRWREMAASQRKVAEWVRAIDSNHVIMSAPWLFGHGALKPEVAELFNYLDVIDVEPALTWTPDSHAFRRAAGKPISIIGGLECYYFQPIEVLRWRTYEALRLGINTIGICPSNMLHPRPEIISYLRGLHGEILGLQAALAGHPPTKAATCSVQSILTWEREAGDHRYLVASLGENGRIEAVESATFVVDVPDGRVEVLYEGRDVAIRQGKFEDRFSPYDVHVYRIRYR